MGIDIAGQEDMNPASTHSFTQNEVMAFKAAKDMGLHRTCHAGEAGPAVNVEFALDQMCAERIGHGYSVIFDEDIYKRCLSSNVHFEVCPYSSYFTGSILPNARNPIVVFAEDNANFSISKDDPTVTGVTLDQEYEYCRQLGLNEMHITRAVSFVSIRTSLELHMFCKLNSNINYLAEPECHESSLPARR